MSDSTIQQPPVFTLGAAAKAAGVSKPSLSKAIKEGRLTAEKRPDGTFAIQAAELFRAYPPGWKGNGQATPEIGPQATGLAASNDLLPDGEANRLREQLATLTAERDRERRQLQERIDDLAKRLDQEGEERRKLVAILTHQREQPEPQRVQPAEVVQPARRGILGLFRRG